MKKFEIPYNFCKLDLQTVLASGIKDYIELVYVPAFWEHTQTTRLELERHPLDTDEYIDHIKFIQEHELKVSILLQGEDLSDDIIDFYINLGIDSFIVRSDVLAKRIKDRFPNCEVIASITKILSVNDLMQKDLSMYDKIVLDFRLNDLNIIKCLPRNHKYIVMPNTPCFRDCPKERCLKHWFNGKKYIEDGDFCSNLWFHKPAFIPPEDLRDFDDYVDSYKLQGREYIKYLLPYYILTYIENYIKGKDETKE